MRQEQDPAFRCASYGAFLRSHQLALVQHRYFPKEWPAAIAAQVSGLTTEEMCCLLTGEPERGVATLQGLAQAASTGLEELRKLPMMELIADWYCLRQGGSLALPHIEARRLVLYRLLAQQFGQKPDAVGAGSIEGFLAIFLGALGQFLDRAERGADQLTITSNLALKNAVA